MKKNPRSAIAMIELIFAIVIMGIVMMSAPQLISTAKESSMVGIQQEGINEASSRVNMIMTYPWDQNDTNDSCIPPVLHVNNGDPELNEESNITARRIGVDIHSSSHTFKCAGKEFSASTVIGKEDDNKTNDIDDFSGTVGLISDASGSGGTDYLEKDTVQMATVVRYLEDNSSYKSPPSHKLSYAPSAGGAGTTNIKEIAVTLTSTSTASELNKTIVLKAFSCNIGGYEYAKRVLP